MSDSGKSGAPKSEKPAKDDERVGRNEATAEKQDREPLEPLDENSLDSVLRDCPL